MGLLVAGGAGDSLVQREPFVIEKGAAEGGTGIGDGIGRRGIVLTEDGLDAEGGGRGGVGVVGGGGGQVQSEGGGAERLRGRGQIEGTEVSGAAGAIGEEGGAQAAIVDAEGLEIRPMGEIRGGLDDPGVVAGIGEGEAGQGIAGVVQEPAGAVRGQLRGGQDRGGGEGEGGESSST